MSLKAVLALVLLSLMWSGSFLFISLSLGDGDGFQPFTVVLLRAGGAVVILGVIYKLTGGQFRQLFSDWQLFLVIGLTNMAIPHFIFAWGQQNIDSGLAAILNSLTPIATVIISVLSRQESFSLTRIIALIVGFTGVVLLVLPNLMSWDANAVSTLVVLLPALLYAVASILSKRFVRPEVNGIGYAFRMTLFATIAILPFSLILEQPWSALPTDFYPAWFGAVMLFSVATALAFPLYFWLIREAGATNTTVVTMLVPIFAIPLGAFILDEQLGLLFIAGTATVLMSLVILDGRVFRLFKRRRT